MKNIVLTYIDRFRHDRYVRLVLGSVLLILAVIVSLCTYWQLRLSGIAMTNETYCGYEEHTHTEECYETVLICELEETEGHTHDETCYDEEGNLICELEESEGHIHSEECYEQTLICELEEHVHTVDCLINLEADVETAVDWEATLPVLTGDLRTDIVNIAYSQIGYTESTANFTLAEDGVTHMGYTRYGAWYGGLYYGSEYSDWDSMFVAFCLDYAGIAEEFTYNSGAFAWSVELSELGYYQSADAYAPEAGDVVFIDTDLDGRADVTAIIVSVDETTITAIQGNYSVSDTESGETIDTVALVEYTLDETVLGYADVDYAEEVEDEEITLDESDEIIAEEIEELDVSAEDFATLEFVGEDYIITVSYGEDAALPEGTELVAYEYAQDSENFLARYAEAAELYGWDDSDETDPYHGFRLFNIGLYYDGAEIEPAAAVTVTVTYTGETDAASVSVTHFTDTSTEPLPATVETTEDTQSVTFTADGFSEYGIMLTANATGPAIADVYGIQDLYVEIVNNIASTGKLEAKLYYLDGDDRVYVTDGSGNDYISSFTGTDSVEYTVTYTWYRSKEPYLATDTTGYADAPAMGTYNYLSGAYTATSTSANTTLGALVEENNCTVNNGSYSYLFYYYYVSVSVTTTENNKTVATYETDYNDIVYATVDGAASYVKIVTSADGKTLTATLYDENGDEYTNNNSNISYTYTWYKSRYYEATDGTNVSSAPYANTIANTNDYVAVSGKSGVGSDYATLTLTDDDSFYFYYLQVTLKYKEGTTTYTAYAKGYQDWAYAGLVVDSTSTDAYTAVIVDDLASSGTFKAVLYDNSTGEVVSGSYTYTWYKSDSEYEITETYTSSNANTSIYSDQNAPSGITYSVVTDTTQSGIFTDGGDAVYVAKNFGALHYYQVEITYDENTYESADKFVQYSDEIENGGFEIGITSDYSQINELYIAYWHTTNAEYGDSHGTYRGSRPIEVGKYEVGHALSATTYAIAYTKAGSAAQDYFAELNATEASTLYQSVITAPGTTYYWSVYHQNRSYTTNNLYSNKDGQQEDQGGLYRQTTKGTGTDSMYVIIMSDADAELLLADVNENDEDYDEQQEVIDAAAAYIVTYGTKETDNYMKSSETYGAIEGCYTGTYTLRDGTTTVDVTLWQVTTTKTVTRVTFYTDSNYSTYANASSLVSDYSASDGWAPITATVSGSTVTVGYYTVTDWVQYTGSYTVPDGQYLTRFFFAAAYAQGGTAAGNFIDGVSLTYAIDYTIEYWVWDYEKCKYVKKDYEEGSATPYVTVNATKTSDYAAYGLVGSVTSYESGGENPESFDDTATTELYVDAYNYVLSLYYGGPGVVVEKVISGVSSDLEGDIDETVAFTVTNTSNTSNTATLTVGLEDTFTGTASDDLDEGTYTITETSCSNSILDKYLLVSTDVTVSGVTTTSNTCTVTIDKDDNPLPTVTFTNIYRPVVTLKKIDSANTVTLSNVSFAMYKITDETAGTKSYYSSYDSTNGITWSDTAVSLKTGTDGTIAYSALPDGTYYLVETGAADGYNILTETLSFTIEDGKVTEVSNSEYIEIDSSDTYGLTLIVKNTPGVELPETGGVSLPAVYGVGAAMILVSAIGLVVRRKKI